MNQLFDMKAAEIAHDQKLLGYNPESTEKSKLQQNNKRKEKEK